MSSLSKDPLSKSGMSTVKPLVRGDTSNMFRLRKKSPDLLNFDWQSVLAQLEQCDPNEGCFFMITLNKGTEDEYRTRFLNYQEAKELIQLALEKQKLRIPLTL